MTKENPSMRLKLMAGIISADSTGHKPNAAIPGNPGSSKPFDFTQGLEPVERLDSVHHRSARDDTRAAYLTAS